MNVAFECAGEFGKAKRVNADFVAAPAKLGDDVS